jgi:hypothetical protein
MTSTNFICVTGYLEGGECAHCGRELRHCIVTDAGMFGARCFAVKVTKPKVYCGKKFRLSTDAVISLARMARDPVRHNLSSASLTFEAA